jgi:hypothetical protein
MPAVGQLKKQAIVTLGASYSGPVARHCCWQSCRHHSPAVAHEQLVARHPARPQSAVLTAGWLRPIHRPARVVLSSPINASNTRSRLRSSDAKFIIRIEPIRSCDFSIPDDNDNYRATAVASIETLLTEARPRHIFEEDDCMAETIRMGGLELEFLHSKDDTDQSLDMFRMTVQPNARVPVPTITRPGTKPCTA